jgi:hypothetical protein
MFMASPTHWIRVKLPAMVRDPWFWIGISGLILMVISRYAEEQGWVKLTGQLGSDFGLVLALAGLITSASRTQVAGIGAEVRASRTELLGVRSELSGVSSELSGVRGEIRDGFHELRRVLVEIRELLRGQR